MPVARSIRRVASLLVAGLASLAAATLALAQARPAVSPSIASAISWYDTLGYPDVTDLPYVQVATGQWRQEAANHIAIERLLIGLLDDRERRTAVKGMYDDVAFTDPRVCDMAALALSKRWPEKYRFNWSASAPDCDAQIRAIRDRWRHGGRSD